MSPVHTTSQLSPLSSSSPKSAKVRPSVEAEMAAKQIQDIKRKLTMSKLSIKMSAEKVDQSNANKKQFQDVLRRKEQQIADLESLCQDLRSQISSLQDSFDNSTLDVPVTPSVLKTPSHQDVLHRLQLEQQKYKQLRQFFRTLPDVDVDVAAEEAVEVLANTVDKSSSTEDGAKLKADGSTPVARLRRRSIHLDDDEPVISDEIMNMSLAELQLALTKSDRDRLGVTLKFNAARAERDFRDLQLTEAMNELVTSLQGVDLTLRCKLATMHCSPKSSRTG